MKGRKCHFCVGNKILSHRSERSELCDKILKSELKSEFLLMFQLMKMFTKAKKWHNISVLRKKLVSNLNFLVK
jgi:hypothetical protein